MTTTHQARLQAALDEIAGEPDRIGCAMYQVAGGRWRADWCDGAASLIGSTWAGFYATPDEAIAAACRTLRAALGVAEPREARLREALRGLVERCQATGDVAHDYYQQALDALEDE